MTGGQRPGSPQGEASRYRLVRELGRGGMGVVARYQRGLRIGGDQGRALLEQARQAALGAGGSERFLQEDVALR